MKEALLDRNSINYRLWKYFIIFAATILAILWLLQIVFLNNFYESMKTYEITKIGDRLRSEFKSDDFNDKMNNYAFQKGLIINLVKENRQIISYPMRMIDVLLPQEIAPREFESLFGKLSEKNRSNVFTIKYTYLENSSLVYTGYLGERDGMNYYLYISSVLEPVDTTVGILKNMLIIVSVLSLVLALILSYFISRRVSKPLIKMSKTAKELANGDYNVHFQRGEYTEIDDLADTLNYATDELTKTIELRKDLIANVSHDLKTPLTVIKSYGEMIRDISGNNEQKRLEHIETIIQETDHLTNLVNDLLNLSKLESQLENIRRDKFDLAETVEEVLERFKLIESRGMLTIETEISGDTTIIGEESKIKQVIYNYVSNAINYSKSRESIIVKVIGDENKVELHVIDHGVGISKEDQESIWNRFYRAGNNHRRSEVGTGLGLYIVKSIMDLHGYDYGVNSELGKGSDFYFIYHRENSREI